MLNQILAEFLKLDGVFAAVVVGRDGIVIESAVSGKVDIDALLARWHPPEWALQKRWATSWGKGNSTR